jgi:hypothetical protein
LYSFFWSTISHEDTQLNQNPYRALTNISCIPWRTKTINLLRTAEQAID